MQAEQAQQTATNGVVVQLEHLAVDAAADVPAFITQREWELLRWRVADTHRAVTDFERNVKPALAAITSGKFGIGSLFGKRGN